MQNEWQLFVESQDVGKGDLISIEEEDGSTSTLRFLRTKGKTVYLSDSEGEVRWFSTESLEELEGTGVISEKVESDD